MRSLSKPGYGKTIRFLMSSIKQILVGSGNCLDLHYFLVGCSGQQVKYTYLGEIDKVHYRARLFKTNDVVSQRFVKISNVNISNMPIFFVEKMREAFAVQKLFSFFQQKNSVYLVIKS